MYDLLAPADDLPVPAYAAYFDHKRRTDPEFRKNLKREARRIAKAAKEEAEAKGANQKRKIRALVTEAQEEGYPTNVEEKEAYFMNEVGRGEVLCQNGLSRLLFNVQIMLLMRPYRENPC